MITLDSNLIAEMKKIALEHPYNPGREPLAPIICYKEDVQYKDLKLNVMLTFEYFTPETDQQIWHWSVARTDHEKLDPIVEQELVQLAFKERGNITKIPEESFLPELRFMNQYIQILQRKFDVDNKQWVE